MEWSGISVKQIQPTGFYDRFVVKSQGRQITVEYLLFEGMNEYDVLLDVIMCTYPKEIVHLN